jgi:hypothetical protein
MVPVFGLAQHSAQWGHCEDGTKTLTTHIHFMKQSVSWEANSRPVNKIKE